MRISDWSSDVCSSDLLASGYFTPTEGGVIAVCYCLALGLFVYKEIRVSDLPGVLWTTLQHTIRVLFIIAAARSDERRVGNERFSSCRFRWSPSHYNKQE